MIEFEALIQKFDKKGEKTNWTYIVVPTWVVNLLNPRSKKTFRVKGRLDNYIFKEVAVLPMGDGSFIMALNADMRAGIGKGEGDLIKVKVNKDRRFVSPDWDFMRCLDEEPKAKLFYIGLPMSQQNYFNKWISTAKTPETKAKRIALTLEALLKKQYFQIMLRENKGSRFKL